MAKSRKIPIADPESSTDESDSEPTAVVPPATKAAHSSSSSEEDSYDSAQPTPVPSVNKAAAADSSSSEEDSDDSEPEPSSVAAAPVPQRPVAAEASAAAGVKRPSTVALEASSVKRSRGEGGKGAVVRVFSNEDEIILLKGRLEGMDLDIDQYCESMMGRLSVSVTKTQIHNKLRRLKNKFFSNREKAAHNKGKSFNEDAHESMAYKISEKIWGNEKGPKPRVGGGGKEKGPKPRVGGGGKEKGSKPKDDVVEEKEGHANYVGGGKSTKEWVYGEGMELLDEDAKMELQSELNRLRKEELEFKARMIEQKFGFKARRIELKRKHLDMVRNAL